ncbi:MAG: class D sortase [Clostridiales bacterium]|jgi:sortase A|nr:class D sortase [Clostridiales bacterium]
MNHHKSKSKSNHKIRWMVGILLLLAGAGFIVFPWAQAKFFDFRQQQLVKNWDAYVLLNSPSSDQPAAEGADIPSPVAGLNNAQTLLQLDQDQVFVENVQPSFDIDALLPYVTGMIVIDKINLRSPILSGADMNNLNLGICELAGAPPMGSAGNYCLAGHKSRVKGRHFSRLSELTQGDIVQLSNELLSYEYEVYETLKLSSDDIWVLQNVTDDAILTMITCDYTQQPVGRLAVRARLIS